MKSLLLFCVFTSLATSSVHSQTTNYILASYDSAMQIKSLYDEQAEYFREYLTSEAEDMGRYFTNMVARGISIAETSTQGEAIQDCVAWAAEECRYNIMFMEYYINAAEEASNHLHLTVFDQLRSMNIKEYDLELFYYYHSYAMDQAYNDLWYWYSNNMIYSSMVISTEYLNIYDQLFECITGVLWINDGILRFSNFFPIK